MLTLLLRLLAEIFGTQRPAGMTPGLESPFAERAVAHIEERYRVMYQPKWSRPNERLLAALRLAERFRDTRGTHRHAHKDEWQFPAKGDRP